MCRCTTELRRFEEMSPARHGGHGLGTETSMAVTFNESWRDELWPGEVTLSAHTGCPPGGSHAASRSRFPSSPDLYGGGKPLA
jgi:hypothetical protein